MKKNITNKGKKMINIKNSLLALITCSVVASAAITTVTTVNPDTGVTRITYTFVEDEKVLANLIEVSDSDVIATREATLSHNLDNLVKLSNIENINPKYAAMNKESAHSAILELNRMIREALYETGVYNDKKFTASDAYTLKKYISHVYNGKFWKQISQFSKLMKEEMHIPFLKSRNAVALYNNIYRDLGTQRYRDLPRLQEVAIFIATLTKDEMQRGDFYNDSKIIDFPSSGTTLDRMIPFILNEPGLNNKLPKKDLIEAAQSASEMNLILVKSIRELGIADNSNISAAEVKLLHKHIVANYAKEWQKAHGLNSRAGETGFHAIQNKGATTLIRGENGINSVGDSVYHLGYASKYPNNLVNENGNKNATFSAVAYWLNVSFEKVDYKNGSLHSLSAE